MKVRYLNEKELELEGWDPSAKIAALLLEDGSKIYPSADSPGELFTVTPDGMVGVHE